MSINLPSMPFKQPSNHSPSIYVTIREHEEAHVGAGANSDGGHSLDERNLDEQFQDQDLEGLLAEAAESQATTESTSFLPKSAQDARGRPTPKWTRGRQESTADARRGLDDELVPESLLLEARRGQTPNRPGRVANVGGPVRDTLPEPVPGPSSRSTRVEWETTREHQRLYDETGERLGKDAPAAMSASGYLTASGAEKAMWMWMNVQNLDNFLAEVYSYYVQKGMWSITLAKVLRLAQLAFVVSIGVVLRYCIDYSKVPQSKTLSEVWIQGGTSNMSFSVSLGLWVVVGYWCLNLMAVIGGFKRLHQLSEFYTHLLGVSDEEIQTISWQEVVGRLMALRDSNPRTALKVSARARRFMGDNSKDRMDAHDIANRIMRKENYLIAMFNKDLLDLSLPIPFLGNRQLYSNNLEWNINVCILDYVFNERGQVSQLFLKDVERKRLIEGLRSRFVFYAFMNLVQAPFLVAYSLADYFFRYFKEFQSNPSQIGSRAYAPMAEWKFREFNELYHFYRRRADMSVPFASRYLDQFPKNKTVQISSFVAFVSGALLALLAIVSLFDPSNFLNFELSESRTVLFYLGVLTVVWTVSKSIVPDDSEVFDPEFAIQEVINYTHYCPAHWKGRLHSDGVRKEFSTLYQMKIVIFLEELMSIIITPAILLWSLPKCSDRIVDFFREFTVHVDGLGYVCSFALFEFQKGAGSGATSKGTRSTLGVGDAAGRLREDYYSSNDNKMLASYYSFIDNYGTGPRRGAPQRQPRQRFHPPPAFPGLSSPDLPRGPSSVGRSDVHDAAQSMRRSQLDPSRSLLLDPNHQPSAAAARRMHKSTSAGRTLHPLRESVRFADDDSATAVHEISPARPRQSSPPKNLSSTAVIEEDSHLGESWRAAAAGATHDDEDDVEDSRQATDRGPTAGVLGMILQFQKTQRKGGLNV